MVICPFPTNYSLNSDFVGHTQYLHRCDRLAKCKVKMARHVPFFLCLFIYRDEIDVYKDTQKKKTQEKVKERGDHMTILLLCMAMTTSIL